MLSLSHSHAASAATPRHRNPRPRHSAASASRRRRASHIAAGAILLPPNFGSGNSIGGGLGKPGGGGGGGGPSDRKLPFTPPPAAPPGQLYQPFHPPPSPLPEAYRDLDLTQRLAVLRDRMGQWYEYAPLIAALNRDGFMPSSIEEATGISGVEQNRLVVAAQVRDSLLDESAAFPRDLVSSFDAAPELLYELRFLTARQRADAARHALARGLDARGARDLARAMKDFPYRRAEDGWAAFDGASPGDCLAFWRFRQSREAIAVEDCVAELERALEVAETEAARARLEVDLDRARRRAAGEDVDGGGADDDSASHPGVPVVRLQYGEVADASTVLLLPVVREADGVAAVDAAPRRSATDVDLGLVQVDKGWARWAVLPGWGPVAEAADEAVVVELADGRALPWRSAEKEKALVIADRRGKEVADEGLYVLEKDGRLVVERGRSLVEQGVAAAAAEVVMVVRPPKEVNDMISDDEWD
ncbi:hypothetical protein PR202_ga00375 [Eleusine coracana subsp. coracana]|uniref:Rubisco accumulation factor 1, chloroplastic n=1 Tax=Eleusine coracana subsp. coracana TaxID=191504 RepID=A0AAV5BFK5_ELECO|nr:hypothetical protein PR202_ga00375 [Eleusine coracana subsp. coracana]